MVCGSCASPQQTLERLEAFTPALAQAQKAGEIARWRTLPLNSLARQKSDLTLLREAAPAVTNVLKSAGLNAVSPNLDAMPSAWTRGLKARPAKAGVCSG